jgi:hypothetical protein
MERSMEILLFSGEDWPTQGTLIAPASLAAKAAQKRNS